MKNKLIRIAPILLIIAIAVLAIILIVNLGKMMFGSDSPKKSSSKTQEPDTSVLNLLKIESGRSVKMTVRGPIQANENARSYSVEVSSSSRNLKVFKGYSSEVEKEVNHDNTTAAYDEFVNALNKANMMKGEVLTGGDDDIRGVCAKGHVYDFAILKDGQVEKHLWTSTCKGSKGSLLANTAQLQDLFSLQIPEFKNMVKDLGLKEL